MLSIGFMLHFHPLLAQLKPLVEDGTLGTILRCILSVGSYITLVNRRYGDIGGRAAAGLRTPARFHPLAPRREARGVTMEAVAAGSSTPLCPTCWR